MAAIISANRAASAARVAERGTRILQFSAKGQGLSGVASLTIDVQTGRYIERLDAGPLHTHSGFDGRQAWSTDLSGAVTSTRNGYAKSIAVSRAYRYANAWWQPAYGGAQITYVRSRLANGHACDLLQVSPLGGAPFKACFDRASHLIVQIIERSAFHPTTFTFSDYKEVDGAQEAGVRVIDDGSGAAFARTEHLSGTRMEAVRLAAAFEPSASPRDFTIQAAAGETTIPFRLIGSHIYGDVEVNNQGPFTFVFDTGAEDTISPVLAKALHVSVAGASPVGGAGAGVEQAGYAGGLTLSLGGLILRNQTLHVLPPVGKGTVDFQVDGVIGAEVSRRVVTRIDYAARTISFIDPNAFDARKAGTAVPIDFYDQVPMIHGAFDGRPTSFIVDTGNGGELDLTSPFVDEHRLIAAYPKGIMAGNLGGIGGGIRFYASHAATVRLGNVKVSDVLVRMSRQKVGALAANDIGGDVGSGLLRRFTVTFDYGRHAMYLQPRSGATPGAGSFDKSGLTLASQKADVVIVSIIPKSPAATAGLQKGDVIMKVDGKLILPTGLSTLRDQFTLSSAGTHLSLVVRRGTAFIDKSLVLRDLIN